MIIEPRERLELLKREVGRLAAAAFEAGERGHADRRRRAAAEARGRGSATGRQIGRWLEEAARSAPGALQAQGTSEEGRDPKSWMLLWTGPLPRRWLVVRLYRAAGVIEWEMFGPAGESRLADSSELGDFALDRFAQAILRLADQGRWGG
jgi:hypothetical protein